MQNFNLYLDFNIATLRFPIRYFDKEKAKFELKFSCTWKCQAKTQG